MIKYLIAFLLFTSPCLAGMGIGGFPYPGPGQGGAAAPYSFCDGSELFCTSWETGTDALNTGATGNEDVFDSSGGTITRVAYAWQGAYGLRSAGSINYVAKGLASEYNSAITTVAFTVEGENDNPDQPSTFVAVKNADGYETIKISVMDDANNYDGIVNISMFGLINGSFVTIGTPQPISIGVNYTFVARYANSSSTNLASWSLYNSSGGEIYSSTPIAVGNSYRASKSIECGGLSYNAVVKIGAIKVTQ